MVIDGIQWSPEPISKSSISSDSLPETYSLLELSGGSYTIMERHGKICIPVHIALYLVVGGAQHPILLLLATPVPFFTIAVRTGRKPIFFPTEIS
jgi:hypothetical protein